MNILIRNFAILSNRCNWRQYTCSSWKVKISTWNVLMNIPCSYNVRGALHWSLFKPWIWNRYICAKLFKQIFIVCGYDDTIIRKIRSMCLRLSATECKVSIHVDQKHIQSNLSIHTVKLNALDVLHFRFVFFGERHFDISFMCRRCVCFVVHFGGTLQAALCGNANVQTSHMHCNSRMNHILLIWILRQVMCHQRTDSMAIM